MAVKAISSAYYQVSEAWQWAPTLLIGIVVIMEVVKTKKEKTPKKVAKAEADDADFMIQPEQVAPRIDTSK